MKRLFDLLLVILLGSFLLIPMALIALVIKLTSKGPVLYWSERVGQKNVNFRMPKFRSMLTGTPAVATHLLKSPDSLLTPVGGTLRRSSLDEFPQLWSILMGNMSFVGPRPALFNQTDLIEMRTAKGIHHLKPGLTGWAQINGRDDIALERKVALDEEYRVKAGFWFDMKILYLTFIKVITRQGITH